MRLLATCIWRAWSMAWRMSLTPESTAEIDWNSMSQTSAISLASVVLPTPGGPRESWNAAATTQSPPAVACPAPEGAFGLCRCPNLEVACGTPGAGTSQGQQKGTSVAGSCVLSIVDHIDAVWCGKINTSSMPVSVVRSTKSMTVRSCMAFWNDRRTGNGPSKAMATRLILAFGVVGISTKW